jgi:broad specificity phosphatase PhoE
MTALWLVRHASTSWTGQRYAGSSDPPLDAHGRQAATRLAAELAADLPRDVRVVTSPRIRATATAMAIAEAAGAAAPEVDDRWREVDMGIAEGLTFDALETLDPDIARRLASGETTIDWPGGETVLAFEQRVNAALTAVLAGGRATVIVSHAGPLRLATARIHGVPVGDIGLQAAGTVLPLEV